MELIESVDRYRIRKFDHEKIQKCYQGIFIKAIRSSCGTMGYSALWNGVFGGFRGDTIRSMAVQHCIYPCRMRSVLFLRYQE